MLPAPYPIRTLEGYIKYHLVFATGSTLGIKLMSDVLFKAENQFVEDQTAYEQQKPGSAQMSLFAVENNPQQKYEQHIKDIESSILQVAGAVRTDWEFDSLRLELTIHQGWFARFSEKQFRLALKNLHQESKITRVSSGGAWGKKTYFRITP
jgi:hypothetical protein